METQILDDHVQSNEAKPAGFWIRVGATLVDFLAYSPLVGLSLYNLYVMKNLPLQLIVSILLILYKPFMEYKYGATLGKMAVKIKVVNQEGEAITLGQSIARFVPWMFSQFLSLVSTYLLFQDPRFLATTDWMQVGVIQSEVVPQLYNTLTSLIMLISVVVVAFNAKKLGLHDMLAGTQCVYK